MKAPGFWIRVAAVCFWMAAVPAAVHAQDDLDEAIESAQRRYASGELDEPAYLLSHSLDNATDEQVISYYRLITLSYLASNNRSGATDLVMRLLQRVPGYQPDPVSDPPAFVAFVTEIRQQLFSSDNQHLSCAEETADATARYVEGAFEQVAEVLTVCLNQRFMYIPVEEQVPVLRLLTLSHLKMGNLAQAKSTAAILLRLKPDYAPRPVEDPPAYVALIEILRGL
jgi:hypothetical protein